MKPFRVLPFPLLWVACLFLLKPCLLRAQFRRPIADGSPPTLIVVGTNTVHLGEVNSYRVVPTLFRLRNTGDTPIALNRVVPTCSCIRGSVNTNLVAAGAEAELTLLFDPETVHGSFRRGLWLETSDPGQPRLTLAVSGTVLPLFAGLPTDPFVFDAEAPQTVWTNHFTLQATEPDVGFDQPLVRSNAYLRVEAHLKKLPGENNLSRYELTTIIENLDFGQYTAVVVLPVTGRPEAAPPRIEFQVSSGSELMAAPNILLVPSAEAHTRRLLIRTDSDEADMSLLSWTPQQEGVNVTVTPASGRTSFFVNVEITPDAAAQILESVAPSLTFHYPGHKSARVAIVTSRSAPEAIAAETARPPQPSSRRRLGDGLMRRR